MIDTISKIAQKLLATAALTALLAVGTAQAADHLTECANEDVLLEALTLLNFTNQKDFDGLTGDGGLKGKITVAFDKVELEGKYCDGIGKLQDFQNKLRKLAYASKPKVAEDPAHPGTLACLFAGTEQLIREWQAVTSATAGCEDPGDPPRGKGPKK